MGTIEYQINPRGKCITCKDYIFSNHQWITGKCVSKTTKAKNKNRNYNNKICLASKFDAYFKKTIKLGRRVESGSKEKCRNCDDFDAFISDIFNEACDWGKCLKNYVDELHHSFDVDGGGSCPDFKENKEVD